MIQQRISLTGLNTFGLPAVAEQFLVLTDFAQLQMAAFQRAPSLVLGGGSNVLLREEIPGLTVQVRLGGVTLLQGEGSNGRTTSSPAMSGEVHLRVGAGVDWNQFVRYTLDQGWAGLENLVLIPGTVGAAPVQNIGAYGAEVAEFVTAVHVWEYGYGARTLSPEDCAFAYRDSRFKQEPGRFLITAVDFRLNQPGHQLRTDYGAIRAALAEQAVTTPTAVDVALAVTTIRRRKLPDWFFLGNSGSFFKNPVVSRQELHRLQKDYADIPAYPLDEERVKLAAGWLIDRAGLRGVRQGNTGTYAGQALVIVNHGGATGREVLAFSAHIQRTVAEKFGVALEREVQLF